ncbi:MAG: hypothetical protein KF729_20365 [Sandaracinaceae bacterium]|nr:hypothetical protein [Sandaracinaceae bacterium]
MRRAIFVTCLLTLLLLPACRRPGASPERVEDDVGRYQVQGTLSTAECGEGYPAPETMSFVVDLMHLPGSSRGYWQIPDGPVVEGILDRAGGFRFQSATQAVAIEPDPGWEVPGCTLELLEVVDGTLEAGASTEADAGVAPVPEARIAGSTRMRIAPVPGGDCRPLVSLYGGPFPELPCRIEYRLAGERIGSP